MLLYSVESSIQLVSRVDKTAIAGVRLLPRKLATLALCLDDIKKIKNKLNAAIDFLNHQLYSNTDLILSNIVGPLDVVTFAKNHITKIWVTTTSPPLALEIHMLTYNGKAFLNVLVAADIIPAPELLCKSRVMDAEDYGSES